MVRGMVHDHALSNLVYATISCGEMSMVVISLCVVWCMTAARSAVRTQPFTTTTAIALAQSAGLCENNA